MRALLISLALLVASCKAPPPGASDAGSDAAPPSGPCAPDDARGEGPCAAVISVIWDGQRCGMLSGCSCSGRDCKRWQGIEACEAAHANCRNDR